MLISKKHLNELVAIDAYNAIELEHQFSCFGGLEVEGITTLLEDRGYVVGKIETIEKHPDADKLNVCQVNVGDETLQIVCGAPNARQGAFVIVAKTGTVLPNDMVIEQRTVRGVDSNGMICSLQEIGLDDKFVEAQYKDGIYLYENKEVTVGANAIEALEFDTDVFDLDITPNRADCLNYRGVAYETAALFDKKVDTSLFEKEQQFGTVSTSKYIETLEIATDKVMDYQLLVFEDVVVKPSPQWMQSFLIASGIRPISNIVDITNYVMLYLGQPLHAFDAKKVNNTHFVIRQAVAGEVLETLDHQNRNLTTDDIVIATEEKAIALAGVMGGSSTAIDETTTSIVIESAIFNPVSIRRTAAKFNLRSDASQRFEKGIDPALPQMALALTTELLVTYADAKVGDKIVAETVVEAKEAAVTLSHAYVQEQLGVDITHAEVIAILARLGFTVEQIDDDYHVLVPTRRTGIAIKQDIIEEIVRLYGYEHIPVTLPVDVGRPVFKTNRDQFVQKIHQKMQGQGLNEILTYSLTSETKAIIGQGNAKQTPLTIEYPLNTERSALRTTTYSHMIETLQYHVNRNFDGMAFYEVTNIYTQEQNSQKLAIGGYGQLKSQKLFHNELVVDFYTMKAWIETIIDEKYVDTLSYVETENTLFHPGVSSDIYLGDVLLGTFGKIHPLQAKNLDVSEAFYLAELDMDVLYDTIGLVKVAYEPVNVLPSISRDLSFVMNKELPVGTLITTIRNNAGADFEQVIISDMYEDEKLGDEKSVTVTITYSNKIQTLTNEAVDKAVESMLAQVKATCGAVLRS